ncbi:hypothetical protein BST61_g1311 [Cercospora zeina]
MENKKARGALASCNTTSDWLDCVENHARCDICCQGIAVAQHFQNSDDTDRADSSIVLLVEQLKKLILYTALTKSVAAGAILALLARRFHGFSVLGGPSCVTFHQDNFLCI